MNNRFVVKKSIRYGFQLLNLGWNSNSHDSIPISSQAKVNFYLEDEKGNPQNSRIRALAIQSPKKFHYSAAFHRMCNVKSGSTGEKGNRRENSFTLYIQLTLFHEETIPLHVQVYEEKRFL